MAHRRTSRGSWPPSSLPRAVRAVPEHLVGSGGRHLRGSPPVPPAAKVIFSNQSIPLGVAPQIQGPTAQAKQTSLHQSDAYAAFPYPGEEVAGFPGRHSAGRVGIPAPAYPFVVTTAYGDDVRRVELPGHRAELREWRDDHPGHSATGGSEGHRFDLDRAYISRDGDSVTTAFAGLGRRRLAPPGTSPVLNGLRAARGAGSRLPAGKLIRTSSLSFSARSRCPVSRLAVPAPPGSARPPQKLTAPCTDRCF